MNVVAKTKKHFKTRETFEAFYLVWTTVIDSTTKEQYTKNLAELVSGEWSHDLGDPCTHTCNYILIAYNTRTP